MNVDYINVPMILGIIPGKSERVEISLEGGVAYNKLRKATNTYSNDIVSGYYIVTNEMIYSLLLGAEMTFYISGHAKIFVNYRYSKDLDFFHARKYNATKENHELWNKGKSITTGIYFTLNRKKKDVD